MKCSYHPEADVIAYCGHCGRGVCVTCRREVQGVSYCEACLAARMHTSIPPPLTGGLGPQPGLALFLGFIPGVGAIYNGQILKAVIQVLFFGLLIGLSHRTREPLSVIFGLGAAAFYFYMVIDSYQTARRRQLGQPVEEWSGLGDQRLNAPAAAIVLIALGVLFLLDNLGVPVFEDAGRYWPLLLIIAGVFWLDRLLKRSRSLPAPSSTSAPKTPGADPQAKSPERGAKEL
ncbi:MAG: LiaI-LiaF-like domain-containing protein [Terriglobia bacterium]